MDPDWRCVCEVEVLLTLTRAQGGPERERTHDFLASYGPQMCTEHLRRSEAPSHDTHSCNKLDMMYRILSPAGTRANSLLILIAGVDKFRLSRSE